MGIVAAAGRRCSLLAAHAQGWALFALQVAFMIAVFGAIPFTDAMIVRYVDDRMRSRVSGHAPGGVLRRQLGWRCGCSGRVVKAAGFETLLLAMAGIALVTLLAILLLPPAPRRAAASAVSGAPPPRSSRAAD